MRSHWTSKVSAALTAVLVAAGLAITVSAQTVQRLGRVNVPFNFENGTQHLPAGTYTIELASQHILMLRGDRQSGLQMVQTDSNRKLADRSKVIFHRYGNRYILREVWTAGEAAYLRCPITKAEKELQTASMSTPNLASAQGNGSEVALLETSR